MDETIPDRRKDGGGREQWKRAGRSFQAEIDHESQEEG